MQKLNFLCILLLTILKLASRFYISMSAFQLEEQKGFFIYTKKGTPVIWPVCLCLSIQIYPKCLHAYRCYRILRMQDNQIVRFLELGVTKYNLRV